MKHLALALVCMAMFVHASPAYARSHKSSRESSSDGYIRKHCKTSACFKKHPSGEYAVPVGRRRRK